LRRKTSDGLCAAMNHSSRENLNNTTYVRYTRIPSARGMNHSF
jgi:hypothetical protein